MLAFSNDYYGMIFRATQSVELFCAYPKNVKVLAILRLRLTHFPDIDFIKNRKTPETLRFPGHLIFEHNVILR